MSKPKVPKPQKIFMITKVLMFFSSSNWTNFLIFLIVYNVEIRESFSKNLACSLYYY